MKAVVAKPKKKLGTLLTGLVAAYYADGNEQHLSAVFSKLRPYLEGYSFSKLGVACPDRRQELTQESLIHILEKLRERKFAHSTDEDGRLNSFLPWACRVHHNLFINETRAATEPSKPSPLDEPLQPLLSVGAAQPDLAVIEEAAAILNSVAVVVASLSPKVRRCFEAYYYQNLNYDQIAELYGYNKVSCRGAVRNGMLVLTAWASRQKTRPSEAIYAALPGLDTGEQFADPTAHRNAPKGYYSRGGGHTRHYDKKRLHTRLAA